MKLGDKDRAATWMAFWGLTGYFIGYEASGFANGIPRDYDMIYVLGAGSVATLLIVLLRSRTS